MEVIINGIKRGCIIRLRGLSRRVEGSGWAGCRALHFIVKRRLGGLSKRYAYLFFLWGREEDCVEGRTTAKANSNFNTGLRFLPRSLLQSAPTQLSASS